MGAKNAIVFAVKNINLFKTIYINFKVLPLSRAIKFPIIVGYNVKLSNIGKIVLPEENVKLGMISIGAFRLTWDPISEPILFDNRGTIEFGGGGLTKIHPGARIHISKGALLTLSGRNTIGAASLIFCKKRIIVGENSGCSWNTQILDTDFHFLYDVVSKEPLKRTVPIFIGNNVFIGNHCNIGKGSRIPDGSVISSWSRVSGSFRKQGINLLIGNDIAHVIDKGYTMTHANDGDLENYYSKMIEE